MIAYLMPITYFPLRSNSTPTESIYSNHVATMSSFLRTAAYFDHLASSLPVPRFAAQLLVTAALLLLSWSFFSVLKYLLTPKPFGFIPHLDDQQMVLGDAGRLAKFIKQKKCHTGELQELSTDWSGLTGGAR
jgi:hypothetical protein